MMKMTKIFSTTCCVSLAIACGSAETSGTVDDFPSVPVPTTSDTVELTFGEQIIPAGADQQVCLFLEPTAEDMWIKAFRPFQGKHGHHLLLMTAVVGDTPGTVRGCQTAEDMIRFRPLISSERAGYEEFPPGYAIRVPRGTQLVLQQHYVNSSENELRVRDVAHMTPTAEANVHTLVGFLGLSDISFSLPPTGREEDLSFDCRMPFDANLMVVGPHMHEWGVRFKAEIGPSAGPMETIIDVQQWTADMRDKPDLSMYGTESARPFKGGDIIRTTCTFKNTRKDSLEFPEEMCATFGYYFPADPSMRSEIVCGGDES
jgi:hypothetical protein